MASKEDRSIGKVFECISGEYMELNGKKNGHF